MLLHAENSVNRSEGMFRSRVLAKWLCGIRGSEYSKYSKRTHALRISTSFRIFFLGFGGQFRLW